MYMLFKYFRQHRQNRYGTTVINVFMGTILVKGSYFCLFPFAWENRIGNTVIADLSNSICYVCICMGKQLLVDGAQSCLYL